MFVSKDLETEDGGSKVKIRFEIVENNNYENI